MSQVEEVQEPESADVNVDCSDRPRADLIRRQRRPLRTRLWSRIAQIAFAIFCFVWTYPLTWAVLSSFSSDAKLAAGSLNPFPEGFAADLLLPWNWGELADVAHWENYPRAWYVASFGEYFLNSVVVAVSVVALVLAMSTLAGYVLGRYNFPGKKLFIGIYAIVAFLPEGYTVIPIWYVIKLMGLQETRLGLILAVSSGGHLLYILLLAAFFSRIPKEVEEAAEVDGAGFLRMFATVMLPMAKPALATVVILEVIRAWNDFFMPLVFSATNRDLRTLAVGLYLDFTDENAIDLASMAAGMTIAFVPVVAVFLALQRYFVEGIAGAVKS